MNIVVGDHVGQGFGQPADWLWNSRCCGSSCAGPMPAAGSAPGRQDHSSVFCGYNSGLDVDVTAEDSSNRGRRDLAGQAGGHMHLFEFKAWQENRGGAAPEQRKERDYDAKYRLLGLPIHLVGVEFRS